MEIMPFAATWMNLEIVIHSKLRERQIYDITYMCHLKKNASNYLRNRNRIIDVKTNLWFLRGRGEKDKLGE